MPWWMGLSTGRLLIWSLSLSRLMITSRHNGIITGVKIHISVSLADLYLHSIRDIQPTCDYTTPGQSVFIQGLAVQR